MKRNGLNEHIQMVLSGILFAGILVLAYTNPASAALTRTYTLDADFDEGILDNVEHMTVHDQLQLNKTLTSLPFIWVPNSNEGTVSKVDTVTGRELGRYRTNLSVWGNPSRTTVDLKGNVWFGNRGLGTVVKIGLLETGQCKDRNGNGTIETSRDLDNDGNVTGAEVLKWGDDECVLLDVFLNNSGSGPRGIAVDASNNLWAGTYGYPYKYYYIDGETGAILREIDVSKANNGAPHTAYGAIIDSNGIIWSSSLNNHLLKINPSTNPATVTVIGLLRMTYGLGIDNDGHIFNSGWGNNTLARITQATNNVDWYRPQGDPYTRGVAVTNDRNVWVANSQNGTVTRLDHDGNILATISVGSPSWVSTPTGVAVDKAGKVWVVNYNDGYIKRINPATNMVDLSKLIIGKTGTGVANHYGYSDMTGFISRTITTKTGKWTVIYNSGIPDAPWEMVSWNNEPNGSVPVNTSITVRVKSSNDSINWSDWETAINGVPLVSTPVGQYIQVEATLQITSGDISPVLSDLTVKAKQVSAGGNVTGGGSIVSPLTPPPKKNGKEPANNKATFGFVAHYSDGATTPSGNLQFTDHVSGMSVHGNVTELSVDKATMTAIFSGSARVDGLEGYAYTVKVVDNGEPGKMDTFNITIPAKSYIATGTLSGGNIQIHDP